MNADPNGNLPKFLKALLGIVVTVFVSPFLGMGVLASISEAKDKTFMQQVCDGAKEVLVPFTQTDTLPEFFALVSMVFTGSRNLGLVAYAAFGFYQDPSGSGIYHVRKNCIQILGGYSDTYDSIFHTACDMRRLKYDFSCADENGEDADYIVWAWKGDYLNLGAGAELGIYKGKGNPPKWEAKINLEQDMNLKLSWRNGSGQVENIMDFSDASGATWWITGFHSGYQSKYANDIKAVFTVNFNTGSNADALARNKRMYAALRDTHGPAAIYPHDPDPRWTFNDSLFIATLVFNFDDLGHQI